MLSVPNEEQYALCLKQQSAGSITEMDLWNDYRDQTTGQSLRSRYIKQILVFPFCSALD